MAAEPEPARPLGVCLGALLRDVLEAVLLAVVLFAVLQLAVQNTVVEGSSMVPSLVDGERLLVNKMAYRFGQLHRGDVVVFHAPEQEGKDFIKRVIGLPGETIHIRAGEVWIDGRLLEEPWRPVRSHDAFGPFVVPPGQVFVLGDNRPQSNDSRSWEAALPQERIVGRAWLSMWPPQTWGVVRRDRPGPAYALARGQEAGVPQASDTGG